MRNRHLLIPFALGLSLTLTLALLRLLGSAGISVVQAVSPERPLFALAAAARDVPFTTAHTITDAFGSEDLEPDRTELHEMPAGTSNPRFPALVATLGTTVSGNISGTWDISGSPYVATGDLVVAADDILTIQPGVEVRFAGSYRLTVYGDLMANGTADAPITFTSHATPSRPGDWLGIRFHNSGGDDRMSHVRVEFAQTGIEIEATDGTASPIIEHSVITQNSNDGISISADADTQDTYASPEIISSTISSNGGDGIYVYGSGGSEDGFARPTIRNNVISSNGGDGIDLYGEGGWDVGYAEGDIIGNSIWGNGGSGISCYAYGGSVGCFPDPCTRARSSPNIIGNVIADNGQTGIAIRANGRTLFPLGRNNGVASPLVANNIIVNNNGDGLKTTASDYLDIANPKVVNNTIVDNTMAGVQSGEEVQSDFVIYNNLIISNTTGLSAYADEIPDVGYNDLWGNATDFSGYPPTYGGIATTNANGDPSDLYYNIFLDPLFVDAPNADYHLSSGSPAIDAGFDHEYAPDNDIDGDLRPLNSGFDIGADERGTELRLHKAAQPLYLRPGEMVTYTLIITNVGSHPGTNVWLTDTLPALQQVVAITSTWGSCTAGTGWGGDATCDLGTMARGDSAHITLTAQVTTTPPQSPSWWLMHNTAWVSATETTSSSYADTTLVYCRVRLNDSPTEYDTVQAAVDASTQATDVVKVAGYCADVGFRDGITQTVYLSKTLTLQGGWDFSFIQHDMAAYPTTLDAQGKGRGLYITGDINPTIEGLRITGGDAARAGGTSRGGGIYVFYARATLTANQVLSNAATDGGGMSLYFSDAIVTDNMVIGNTAGEAGGGLHLVWSNSRLSENTVTSNIAGYGGGLYLNGGDAALSENTVTNNTAEYEGGGLNLGSSNAVLNENVITGNTASNGGGLKLSSSDAVLSENTITSNTANVGGGLYLSRSDARLNENSIAGNAAEWGGGGLYLASSDAILSGNTVSSNTADTGGGLDLSSSDATLTNNVVADNQASTAGSGLYILGSSPRLLHNTIARNSGGDGSGVYVTDFYDDYSTVVLTNTILVGHTVGITVTTGNTATLESTLWGSGAWANDADWGGPGAINHSNDYIGDPAFVAPDAGDYHLDVDSAAIDAGVDAGVTTDIDGDTRPQGAAPDLGADEYPSDVPPTLTPTSTPTPTPTATHSPTPTPTPTATVIGKVYLPILFKDR